MKTKSIFIFNISIFLTICICILSTFANELKHNYRLIEERRFDYSIYKRLVVSIYVSNDYKSKDIKAALDQALSNYMKKDFSAVAINAYRENVKDTNASINAVGTLIYAPNGKWGDSSSKASFKQSVTINEKNKAGTISTTLINKKGLILGSKKNPFIDSDEMTISNVYKTNDLFTSENIKFSLDPKTEVFLIKKVTQYITSDRKFAHYYIEYKGSRGWVWESEVKEVFQ